MILHALTTEAADLEVFSRGERVGEVEQDCCRRRCSDERSGSFMSFGLANIGLNVCSMVSNHWSNDGMVTFHRYGL